MRWHEEPGTQEAAGSERVHAALRAGRWRVRTDFTRGQYHPDDLPFDAEKTALTKEEWDEIRRERQAAREERERNASAG